MGENTAACLAGVMSFEDALGLVPLRGQLFDDVPAGGMLSVPLPEAALAPLLGTRARPRVRQRARAVRRLRPAAGARRAAAAARGEGRRGPADPDRHRRALAHARADPRPSSAPTCARSGCRRRRSRSSRTAPAPGSPTRRRPTRTTGSGTCATPCASPRASTSSRATPRACCSRSARAACSARSPSSTRRPIHRPSCSSLRHPDETADDATFLLAVLGRLWAAGGALDAEQLFCDRPTRRRVPLPTYAFQRQRYLIEPGRRARSPTERARSSRARIAELERWFVAPVWRRADVSELAAGARRRAGSSSSTTPASPTRFAARLARGHAVVEVRAGDTFDRASDDRVRAVARARPRRLRRAGPRPDRAGRVPSRILHLCAGQSGERSARARASSTATRSTASTACSSWRRRSPARTARRRSTARGHDRRAGRRGGEAVPYPEKATVLGPCKVIPRELPGVSVS